MAVFKYIFFDSFAAHRLPCYSNLMLTLYARKFLIVLCLSFCLLDSGAIVNLFRPVSVFGSAHAAMWDSSTNVSLDDVNRAIDVISSKKDIFNGERAQLNQKKLELLESSNSILKIDPKFLKFKEPIIFIKYTELEAQLDDVGKKLLIADEVLSTLGACRPVIAADATEKNTAIVDGGELLRNLADIGSAEVYPQYVSCTAMLSSSSGLVTQQTFNELSSEVNRVTQIPALDVIRDFNLNGWDPSQIFN